MILREVIHEQTENKTDDIRRERYFTKMIENAENALREYLQERGGEQTLYVTEYMQRRSYLLEWRKSGGGGKKRGGIDAVTKKQTTYRIRAPTGKSITPTLKN